MTSKKKLLVIFSVLVLVMVLGSWGVVYASAERMLTMSPTPGALVSNEEPSIGLNWLELPGVRISSLKVAVDGQPQVVTAPASGTGFAFTPPGKLAQGNHGVEVEVTYGLGVPRTIKAAWSFTVDTIPPEIALADGAAFYVSSAADATVPITSEAGAGLALSLNDRDLGKTTVPADGRLEIPLRNLAYKNELKLEAADKAGNIRSLLLPVIKDTTDPAVGTLEPGEGSVVRTTSPVVNVSFKEEETGIKNVKLLIDGTEAVSKGDDGTKRVTYLGRLLADGQHQARVEAVDYAGRSVVKEWAFTVDSRRIVVNRGERKLYFYQNGRLQQTFGVAVGMPQYPTPGGRFRIISRQVNPIWINPGSAWAKDMPKTIPAGPSNPLGVRALGLNVPAIYIHGTSDYGSIGRAASHGCIRMRNDQIVNFFPMVGVGVPVDIIN